MDVYLQNRKRITLDRSAFVGQGGEGAVYAKGGMAYKLYGDPGRMIPIAKCMELSVLSLATIIRPEEVLFDRQLRPIGYTMRWVNSGIPLCQIFPRSFREREGVTADQILRLVQRLQRGVRHIHEKGILIVDLNEMNFLFDLARQDLFFIDVDSYQTPGFPATAIMDSVRDRHATVFTEETDWFSFGIVSFQLFTGIHPFRGKHSTLQSLDARMKANVSVYDPAVTMPPACYPVSSIPSAYRDWYRALFQDGKRPPPPENATAAMLIARKHVDIAATGRLRIEKVASFPEAVTDFLIVQPSLSEKACLVVTTTGGVYVDGALRLGGSGWKIGLTSPEQHPVAAALEEGRLRLHDAGREGRIAGEFSAQAIASVDGRLLARNLDTLFEVELLDLPAGVAAGLRPIANVMENATRLFSGAAVQSILGACYMSLTPGPGVCHTIRVPELDAGQVVEAAFQRRVLMAVIALEGRYDRYVIRLAKDYQTYDVRVERDVIPTGLNFFVLETGVCLNLNEQLEVFSNRMDSAEIRRFDEPALGGGRLLGSGATAFFARDGELFKLAMGNG